MALQRRKEIVLVKSLHLLGGERRRGRSGNECVEVSVQRDEESGRARGEVTAKGEGWLPF